MRPRFPRRTPLLVGYWLYARMKRRGWSPADLADRFGLSSERFLAILAGGVPEPALLVRLAEALGRPDELPGVLPPVPNPGLAVGCLARTDNLIGHVEAITGDQVSLAVFDAPGVARRVDVDAAKVQAVTLAPQTRVFVRNEHNGWQAGRVAGAEDETYVVSLPDGAGGRFAAEDIFVQAQAGAAHPAHLLAARCHDTAYFADARIPLVQLFTAQRSTAAPLMGLYAAAVDLLPHQAEIVRRILSDPRPRYVLADEVGLGKTIEACAVARQWLLDDPDASVCVVVPETLAEQWQREWAVRFAFPGARERIRLRVMEHLTDPRSDASSAPDEQPGDLVIVDEAHRLVGSPHGPAYAWVTWASKAARGVLLLTATPATLSADGLHKLLHVLDPVAYREGDEELTAQRRGAQQTLGRHLVNLSDPNVPAFIIEEALDALERDLDLDDTMRALATAVRASLDDDSHHAPLAQFVERAQERYRLFHRLLRFRRRDVEGRLLVTRDRGRLVEEEEADDRSAVVLEALDAWRAVLASTSDAEDHQTQRAAYCALYLSFAAHAETDRVALRMLVQSRLLDANPVLPRVRGESEALTDLGAALAVEPGETTLERGEVLFERVTRLLGRGVHTVVFADDPGVLAHLAERLGKHHQADTYQVFWHTDARRDNLNAFGEGEADVLLADASAEEGLNLQAAGALVLASLPWDLNRLEQRLGRLDRLGRRFPFDTYVLLSDAQDDRSPQRAWFRLVREALEGFTVSMSDLQFFLEEKGPQLQDVLFTHGPLGVMQQLDEVAEQARRARHAIHEQDMLDALQARFQDEEGVAAALETSEAHANEAAEAFRRWMQNVWNMRGEAQEGGVRYRYDRERTLLPLDAYLDRFLPYAHEAFTAQRAVAQQTSASLLRWGHPFVSQVLSLVEIDDRGRAYAVRRFAPQLHTVLGTHDWLGFKALVVVEADPAPLWAWLMEHDLGSETALAALRRRADAVYRPVASEHVVGLEGDEVTDPRLLGLLKPPFRVGKDASGEVNFTKERLAWLDALVPVGEWKAACERAGRAVARAAESSPVVVGERQRSAAHLEAYHARLAQMGAPLPYADALWASITKPRVRVDVMGFWHLSTSVRPTDVPPTSFRR